MFGGGQFEDSNRSVEPVKNTSSPVVGLTPQQEAEANKRHNQQSSLVFGSEGHYYRNNDASKSENRLVGDAENVKIKQRCTFNPITGQTHEEEGQQRETIKEKHISYQQKS
jgi:hypothetical protein